MHDLFSASNSVSCWQEPLCHGAVVLRQFAAQHSAVYLDSILNVADIAPFRKMSTAGGGRMSVGLTACGRFGWLSDERGYRYASVNPFNQQPWPEMPACLMELAVNAAGLAGYKGFEPDSCLINCYEPGSKMGLHQDKNERDFSAPIVSVSLGVPATFLFGGQQRTDKPTKIPLQHGDVVVWGGSARFNFHGVLTVRKAFHPLTGDRRFNLTFRQVA